MIDILKTAINNGQTVSFIYDGKTRIVEVHAVGNSTKNDNLVMRGFQVAGERAGWALFTVGKITGLEISPFPLSEAPREGYKMDDKQMSTVLFQIILEIENA